MPDHARLWRAVYNHYQVDKKGKLKPGFFKDPDGVSCDLAAYTTEDRARLGLMDPPRPDYSGLVEITVGDVRGVSGRCDVKHDPLRSPKTNYAHCHFTDLLSTGQAKALNRASIFRVAPDVQRIRSR